MDVSEERDMIAALKREAMEARMAVVRIEAERDALQQQLEDAYRDLAAERASKEPPFVLSSPIVLPVQKTREISTLSPAGHRKEGDAGDTAGGAPAGLSVGGGVFGGNRSPRSGRDVFHDDPDGGLQKKMKAMVLVLQGAATSLCMRREKSSRSASMGENSVSDPHTDLPRLDTIFSDLEVGLGPLMTSWKTKDDRGAWSFRSASSRSGGAAWPPSSQCSSVNSSLSSSLSASSFSCSEECMLFSSPSALLDAILEALLVMCRYFARDGIHDEAEDEEEEEEEKRTKEEAVRRMEEEEEEEGILRVEEVPMAPKDFHRSEKERQVDVAAHPSSASFPLPLNSSAVAEASSSPPHLPSSPTASSTHSRLGSGSSADPHSDASTRPPSSVSDDTSELYCKALYRVGQAYGGLVRDVHDLLFQRRVLLRLLQPHDGSSRPSSSALPSQAPPLSRATPPASRPSPVDASWRKGDEKSAPTPGVLWWRVRVIAIMAAGRLLKLVRAPPVPLFSSFRPYGSSWASCGGGESECVRVAIGPLPDGTKKGGGGGGGGEWDGKGMPGTTPLSSSFDVPSIMLRLRLPPSSFSFTRNEETAAAARNAPRGHGPTHRGSDPPSPSGLLSATTPQSVGTGAIRGEAGGIPHTPPRPSQDSPPFLCPASSHGRLMRAEVKAALGQALMDRPPSDYDCPMHSMTSCTKKNDGMGLEFPMWMSDAATPSTPSPSVVWCARRQRQAEAAQVLAVLLVLQQVIEEGEGEKHRKKEDEKKKKKEMETTRGDAPLLLQRLGMGLSDALQRLRGATEGTMASESERVAWMGSEGRAAGGRGVPAETHRTTDRRRVVDPVASLAHFQNAVDPAITGSGEEVEACSAILSRHFFPNRKDPLSRSSSRGGGGVVSGALREMMGYRMPGVLPSLSAFSTASSTSSFSFGALPANRRSASHLSSGVDSRREERGVEDEEDAGRSGEERTVSGAFAQEVLGVIHALDEHLSSALSRSRSSYEATPD